MKRQKKSVLGLQNKISCIGVEFTGIQNRLLHYSGLHFIFSNNFTPTRKHHPFYIAIVTLLINSNCRAIKIGIHASLTSFSLLQGNSFMMLQRRAWKKELRTLLLVTKVNPLIGDHSKPLVIKWFRVGFRKITSFSKPRTLRKRYVFTTAYSRIFSFNVRVLQRTFTDSQGLPLRLLHLAYTDFLPAKAIGLRE